MNKELLTRAFEKLGPKKVERGLTGVPGDNIRCFLARAYGSDGMLLLAARARANPLWRRLLQHTPQHTTRYHLGGVLGLSAAETDEVMREFDFDDEAFLALAREWLELNRTPAAPKVLV